MKHLFEKKISLLFLFLMLCGHSARAQSLENAFGAFGRILAIVGSIILVWFLTLMIFLVKRGRAASITSGILGGVMMAIGIIVSALLGDYPDPIISSVTTSFTMAGAINLVLVFSLNYIFPRKKKSEPEAESENAVVKPLDHPVVKVLSVFLSFFFFYQLYETYDYWKMTMSDSDYRVIAPVEIYFRVLETLYLTLNLVTLICFLKGKRLGWNLLMFFSFYTLLSHGIHVFRTAFVAPYNGMETPFSFRITQGLTLIFFALCITLIVKESVRDLYRVPKQSAIMHMIVCIASVCVLAAISNMAFS